ncbi:MAG: DUF4212 domain-containing protein [Myxococcota bacterium]|nr:DUF4212 domain-containing protein [Myxococcota bacterium]
MEDQERGAVSEAISSNYWRTNLRIMALLLSIWFVASFVLGIILVEPLNAIALGGFPLGFWFAQQGSIYVFIVLILVYAVWMDRVDRRYTAAQGRVGRES